MVDYKETGEAKPRLLLLHPSASAPTVCIAKLSLLPCWQGGVPARWQAGDVAVRLLLLPVTVESSICPYYCQDSCSLAELKVVG